MSRLNSTFAPGLGALLLVSAPGCSLAPPTVGERAASVKDSQAESAYQASLARYTDRAEVYDLLNTRMFAAATFQAWPFREARVHRLALFQVQPAPVEQRHLLEERSEFESFHEFFFGAHVNNYRYDDFDRPNTIWRIALVSGAVETTPVSVQRLGRSNLDMRAIYPYMDDFWVAYRIRFPRTTREGQPVIPPGTSRVMLRLASTLGKAEMSFPAE